MKESIQQPHYEIQSLTSTSTTPSQNRVVIVISVVLILICVVAYPYATVSGLRAPATFMAFTVLAVFAALMTAYLLFGQFLGTRLPAMAVLGGTYLYVSLINVFYLLILPGIFGRRALFNAEAYTPAWIWIFLQIGYPLGIFLYVSISKRYGTTQLSPRVVRRLLFLLSTTIPFLTVFLFYIAIDPHHMLPNIVTGDLSAPTFIPLIRVLIFSLNGLMCVGALFLLHNHNVLHLWLRLSTLAALINVSFNLFSGGRYSIGWYISRANGLMAATFVLCALLYEVNRLYTRLVQQNEELAKQNRIQSDFLSVVGHEFRTSLTSILGFSEIMSEKGLDDDDVQEYANDIHSDATRLTRLINDLLDLERMKSGRMEMNREQVELNPLIQEIVNRANSTLSSERIKVDLDITMPAIQADSDKLTQVITNLLTNALKYSPDDNGPILIKSMREGTMAHLFVKDHGMGIPQENLEQIFERYARVESNATRYIGGTGLGLPIVRQIVEMHQGKVWAESTIGNGSVFHVLLPYT